MVKVNSKRLSQQVAVIGCQIEISSVAQAVADILQLAPQAMPAEELPTPQLLQPLQAPQASQVRRGSYVCLANVHMCMEAIDDPAFAQVLQQAALVLADGRPVYWAQRLLGAAAAKQVRGLDLVLALCQSMQQKGLRLGIYGGQDEALLAQLKLHLLRQFSDLSIVYAYAPPFRPLTAAEDAVQVAAINAAKVDVLLVGLGCPKQECWMAAHQSELSAVMLGVGAAFDFIAGRKAYAPKFLQALGLEWLFRLLSEPRRLSGRYVKHNPRFILRFGAQYFRSIISRLSGK